MKQFILSFLLYIMAIGVAHGQEEFTVYFDFNIDDAEDTSDKNLSDWIANNNAAQVVSVYGYTDSVGNEEYNVKLSARRATWVYNQLKKKDMVTANTDLKGLGESTTFAQLNKNRRVVIEFTKPKPLPLADEEPKPEVLPKPDKPKVVLPTLTQIMDAAKKGDKIVLQNIYFYNDTEILLPKSRHTLNELVATLQDNVKLKIEIQGHKCCSPLDDTDLAGDRAKTVYQYLKDHGINKKRLSYKGFGGSRPIYAIPEKNEEQREANRRVEIEIIER